MNTLLEAIQKHPEAFIDTVKQRAMTTPSVVNGMLHLELASRIENSKWEGAKEILSSEDYYEPLNGVIFCLSRYSYLEGDEWCKIVDLFNEGKIV